MSDRVIIQMGGNERLLAIERENNERLLAIEQENAECQRAEERAREQKERKALISNCKELAIEMLKERCGFQDGQWQKMLGEEEKLDRYLVGKVKWRGIYQGVVKIFIYTLLIVPAIATILFLLWTLPQVTGIIGAVIDSLLGGAAAMFISAAPAFLIADVSGVEDRDGAKELDFMCHRRKLIKSGEYKQVLEEVCSK